MAALFDHADSDGLLRDSGAGILRPCTAICCCVLSGEHTFSEEQEEMYVDASMRRVQLWRGVAYG